MSIPRRGEKSDLTFGHIFVAYETDELDDAVLRVSVHRRMKDKPLPSLWASNKTDVEMSFEKILEKR